MTDEDDLIRLQAHLRATPPLPDPAARAAALAAALSSFDRQHEGAAEAAPEDDLEDRPAPAARTEARTEAQAEARPKAWQEAPAEAEAKAPAETRVETRAAETFAKIAPGRQGTAAPPRLTSDRPKRSGRRIRGFGMVASRFSTPAVKGAMAGSTALAALAVAVIALSPALNESPPTGPMAALPEQAEAPQPLARKAVGLAAPPAPSQAPMRLARPAAADAETFATAEANPVQAVDEAPVSTFSVDVDTASYGILRQSLEAGQLPPKAAIRLEEMLNYFPYAYPQPEGETPFRPDITVFETPWNAGTQLVRIALQGRSAAMTDRPPLNLVFLVDTSGSMEDPRKLPLLQQALRLVLPQLRDSDQVAIVSYAGAAGVVLPPTKATQTALITAALDGLTSGGGTAGEAGLAEAYGLAAQMQAPGEVSRVLLATDGDFNLGLSDPKALSDFIAAQRDSGAYLSVLGFGRGNLDDATMQALAQTGNGFAAYIDTLQEARKVLVDQLSGALFPLADDVKVQVEWNPAAIAEYRLLGYETRALDRAEFNNDRVDAGEIGAGLQVTALYEVTPVGSSARLTDPLRYGAAPGRAAEELGFLRLRWKAPGATDSALIEAPIPATLSAPDADARFAAAIAGFGQLLTGAPYLDDWGWAEAIALAEGARGEDPFGYRIEAVNLMRLAASLQR